MHGHSAPKKIDLFGISPSLKMNRLVYTSFHNDLTTEINFCCFSEMYCYILGVNSKFIHRVENTLPCKTSLIGTKPGNFVGVCTACSTNTNGIKHSSRFLALSLSLVHEIMPLRTMFNGNCQPCAYLTQNERRSQSVSQMPGPSRSFSVHPMRR